MIIDGNLASLNINGSFTMKNKSGEQIFNVKRNKYMPNKLFITNPANNIQYIGELLFNINNEEFVLYEESSEILRIQQITSLSVPKFNIASPFGNYSAKFSVRKQSFSLSDDQNEILTFSGNLSNCTFDIDDNCNIFYVMCVAYGLTMLLNTNNT